MLTTLYTVLTSDISEALEALYIKYYTLYIIFLVHIYFHVTFHFVAIASPWVLILSSKPQPSNFFCPFRHWKLHKSPMQTIKP